MGRGDSKGRSGRSGQCKNCNRKFVQGGLKDYQKYHLVLEQRILEMKLPEDVESEVLQMATMDVLGGKGYCWSVELKKSQAYRNVRGEWGDHGSDHWAYKAALGESPNKRSNY